jgi:hypothetical protein
LGKPTSEVKCPETIPVDGRRFKNYSDSPSDVPDNASGTGGATEVLGQGTVLASPTDMASVVFLFSAQRTIVPALVPGQTIKTTAKPLTLNRRRRCDPSHVRSCRGRRRSYWWPATTAAIIATNKLCTHRAAATTD